MEVPRIGYEVRPQAFQGPGRVKAAVNVETLVEALDFAVRARGFQPEDSEGWTVHSVYMRQNLQRGGRRPWHVEIQWVDQEWVLKSQAKRQAERDKRRDPAPGQMP